MRHLLPLFLLLQNIAFSQTESEKQVSEYLNSIKNNQVMLTAFFHLMPKGGDLHHHYSGSIYAETYYEYAVNNDYWIDIQTLKLYEKSDSKLSVNSNIKRFSTLKSEGNLDDIRYRLLKLWSIKDYVSTDDASDRHFFNTFPNFNTVSNDDFAKGIKEIKNRAKSENVQYIETMLKSIKPRLDLNDLSAFDAQIKTFSSQNRIDSLSLIFDEVYSKLLTKGITESALKYNSWLEDLHKSQFVDDSVFTLRYQNYIIRVNDNAVEVFTSLVASFISADNSPLIVGVNIVAPEDDAISMSNYRLHIQMFDWCKRKFSNVKFSMHAGELTLGLVKPEELTWHINAAVRDAGAYRIGHGVDIAYETDAYDLLFYMHTHKIPVEINLTSNEFILKIKDDRHPIILYRDADVPIVICTDDAGVLRSNLTEQYVLLANRYKDVTYFDIKQYVFNSINYSFLEDEQSKLAILDLIKTEFLRFETKVLTHNSKKK